MVDNDGLSMQQGFALLDDSAIETIEKNADHILQYIGVELQDDPTSIEMLEKLGASADGMRVCLNGPRLREFIKAHAPSHFIWQGSKPERSIKVGGQSRIFAPVYGPPRVKHLDGSFSLGTLNDYRALVALCHRAEALGTTGFMLCYVHDVPKEERHIAMAEAHLTLSDKPFMGTVFSPRALNEVIDLLGPGEPDKGHCKLLHLLNSTPPLAYQKNPLQCLRAASLRGQGCMVTSYMMMGSMSPVSVAGTLAQGYAEVLVGLALTQLYRAGTPVVFGLYAMPFSMNKMLPVFGDPISNLVQLAGLQLGRRLGIPCRADGGVSSANIDDAQAGYEGAAATASAFYGGADLILHSAGWLESGRCVDMGKLLREAEALKRFAGC